MDLFNNFSFSQFVVDFLLNDWSIPIPFWLNSNGPFEQMSLSSEEETSTKFAFSPDSVNVWFSVRWLHCFCSFIRSAWTSATLNSAIYVQSLNQRRSAPSYFHLTHWNVNKPTHFFFFLFYFFFFTICSFCAVWLASHPPLRFLFTLDGGQNGKYVWLTIVWNAMHHHNIIRNKPANIIRRSAKYAALVSFQRVQWISLIPLRVSWRKKMATVVTESTS